MQAFYLLQSAPHFRVTVFLPFTLGSHSWDCCGHYHHHHHCWTCKTSQIPWSLYLVPRGGYGFPPFPSLASSPPHVINKVMRLVSSCSPLFVTSSWALSSASFDLRPSHPWLPFLSSSLLQNFLGQSLKLYQIQYEEIHFL